MAPLLSLDGVHKSYWRGRQEVVVLADVSLEVRAGELVAIWGRRRAGKTTFAKVAAGFEIPDRGTVSFAGRDLATVLHRGAAQSHLQEIAWVHHARPSLDIPVVESVALPLLGKKHTLRSALRRAASMLERLGLMDCAQERWTALTDGQRALVAIASALVQEPKLLIADDLGVSLDSLQRDTVMALLRQVADEEGLGILTMVTDMPEMLFAHRIASLSEGRLTLPSEPLDDRANIIPFPAKRQSA